MPDVAAAAATINLAVAPVVFLDTCVLLDVVRAPLRNAAGNVGAATEVLTGANRNPPTIYPVIACPTPTEWGAHIDDAVQDCEKAAWFKNAGFRVTLGTSARTLIGPALERVFVSPWLPCWDFRSARTACTPEAPASERAADPSATPQDSCRLDWGLHCAGTGGGSGRTEAASGTPPPTAAAGRSSFAAGC